VVSAFTLAEFSWKGDPFLQGPYVIGQSGSHRRRSALPFKLQTRFEVDHPAGAARLMHRRVEQIGRRKRLGFARRPGWPVRRTASSMP